MNNLARTVQVLQAIRGRNRGHSEARVLEDIASDGGKGERKVDMPLE